MGTYFNPPDKLRDVARKIEGNNYDELVKQLDSDEELFGHYQRPMFQNAVHLYSQAEFSHFQQQTGIVLLGYYAMPASEYEKLVNH